jgi:hypothetical protein
MISSLVDPHGKRQIAQQRRERLAISTVVHKQE